MKFDIFLLWETRNIHPCLVHHHHRLLLPTNMPNASSNAYDNKDDQCEEMRTAVRGGETCMIDDGI